LKIAKYSKRGPKIMLTECCNHLKVHGLHQAQIIKDPIGATKKVLISDHLRSINFEITG